jgi:hypothetical protein
VCTLTALALQTLAAVTSATVISITIVTYTYTFDIGSPFTHSVCMGYVVNECDLDVARVPVLFEPVADCPGASGPYASATRIKELNGGHAVGLVTFDLDRLRDLLRSSQEARDRRVGRSSEQDKRLAVRGEALRASLLPDAMLSGALSGLECRVGGACDRRAAARKRKQGGERRPQRRARHAVNECDLDAPGSLEPIIRPRFFRLRPSSPS